MYEISVTRRSIRDLEFLSRTFPKVFREEVLQTLDLIDARLTKEIVEKTPRGVGGQAGLAGSIHGEVVQFGRSYLDRIGTPLEYAPVIELGRRPGQRRPPVAPIALWARRILGLPSDEAERAAYAISIAIGRRGFPGRFMFERTAEENDNWVRSQLSGLPDRIRGRIYGAG